MNIIKRGWWKCENDLIRGPRFEIWIDAGRHHRRRLTVATPGFVQEPQVGEFVPARTDRGRAILLPGNDDTPRALLLLSSSGPIRGRIRVDRRRTTADIGVCAEVASARDNYFACAAIAKPGDRVVVGITDRDDSREFFVYLWTGEELATGTVEESELAITDGEERT